MALDQSALLEVLDALKGADVEDRIRQAATTIYQALIEAELTSVIGAAPHERTEARTGLRNGHRPKTITTTAGDLQLQIPKLRAGSFFPSLLERRRRVDQSLFAVIMEAYLHGTSTRKVDDLVKALGADTGISKSEVSRICAELDVEVAAFRDRSLADQPFRYVFLDATYCKARVDHRVVSQAVVVATGVAADGRREVLGFDVGDSEDGAFWTAFLRTLKTRGLHGVQLVISDAHAGLKTAIQAVLLGAAWQRCRVHFLRNVLAQVPKGHAEMVAAAIRTIFAQPDPDHVREQLTTIAGMLGRQLPKVETMLTEAADDVTAFADFPLSHWKKIWSTNPLERVNKEIKRRTDVVGVFPNPAALLRLAGSVLVETHDEWQVTDRRYLSESSMALLDQPAKASKEVETPALLTA
ncbi:IS256 family transposase [Actinoallomurus sp. NBC_01490]|jgi:putative transposase|uniref:IS256 family transposase n=1 Tax=Actinoallomurus sp. NBC_01490 TaxID=2903557 RepID=UPI002E374AD7|nr:IS256 family transposase [Actinoallomurus sp. NBC_01490]